MVAPKRILILGASGGTGRALVRQALDANLGVTAFVRDPARLPVHHAALRVVRGDIGDASAVAAAIQGHDAVVSALGSTKPLSGDPVVIDGIRHTLHAMQKQGVRRLVYLSFMGVTQSRSDAGLLVRFVARHPLRHEIADHEAKEALISASDTDWTVVRAPKLTDGPATGNYRTGVAIAAQSIFPTLSRADVAGFMIRVLLERTHVREAARILP
jgi:putative NADH-flavin reductase